MGYSHILWDEFSFESRNNIIMKFTQHPAKKYPVCIIFLISNINMTFLHTTYHFEYYNIS